MRYLKEKEFKARWAKLKSSDRDISIFTSPNPKLKLIIGIHYSKIELVQNVYVQEDGKIGAELSELKLEELDKLDDGVNLIVTDVFDSKIICEYHTGSLREIITFEEEEHLFLFPNLYVIQNKEFYS